MLKGFVIGILIIVCAGFLCLLSCNDEIKKNDEVKKNKSHQAVDNSSIREGRRLAAEYCQSCHMLPDPSLLDAKSWETTVLPRMGPRLGIFEFNFQRYPFYIDRNMGKDFYPSQPLIDLHQWRNIMDYYGATSPDTLNRPLHDPPIGSVLSLFKPEIPRLGYDNPAISCIKIDTQSRPSALIACDFKKQIIYRFNMELNVIDSMNSSGGIVDIDLQNGKMLTCNMGIFAPTNEKYGDVRYINLNSKGEMEKDTVPLFDKLSRPVQLLAADLNNDKKTDYVVCGFGYLTGELLWMEALGNNKFQRHVLRPVSGAVKACAQDYNNDGLLDLWVLFAQGEEGVFLFTNKGHGNFDQKEVLRFPAVYGSSYFELADFNNDGFQDILYTCGDNADYSSVLKPYHGAYIFLNDGRNIFKKAFFYPIDGCYKAIARDFDKDGDLDLATIAFFADYIHLPEESFIYFENKGGYKFQPASLPEAKSGRWITMDAGDLDGDGYLDIVLGNFAEGPEMMKSSADWRKGPPFLLLKNTGK